MPGDRHTSSPSPAAPHQALSIRARLRMLAALAIVPLLIDRILLEAERTERFAAAAEDALDNARRNIASQQEGLATARAMLQWRREATSPWGRGRRAAMLCSQRSLAGWAGSGRSRWRAPTAGSSARPPRMRPGSTCPTKPIPARAADRRMGPERFPGRAPAARPHADGRAASSGGRRLCGRRADRGPRPAMDRPAGHRGRRPRQRRGPHGRWRGQPHCEPPAG